MSYALSHKKQVETTNTQKVKALALKSSYAQNTQEKRKNDPVFNTALQVLAIAIQDISSSPQGPLRNAKKRHHIAQLLPTINQAKDDITAPYHNPLITQVMVWAFDIGDITTATHLSTIALTQNQIMPERFTRNLHTYLADSHLEYAQTHLINHPHDLITHLETQLYSIKTWPIHQIILAKYHNLLGKTHHQLNQDPQAHQHLIQAHHLHTKTKNKTLIHQIQKKLELPPPGKK